MPILIADTSVLIDLHRGDLLESAFSCGLVMAIPDYLYQIELEQENGAYLRALGLGVLALSPDELALAQTAKAACPSLSLPDCFALVCALRADHSLLTGDANLRREAEARHAQVFGLLWLLDQMRATGRVPLRALHDGLTRISADKRARLPMDEVRQRLADWAGELA